MKYDKLKEWVYMVHLGSDITRDEQEYDSKEYYFSDGRRDAFVDCIRKIEEIEEIEKDKPKHQQWEYLLDNEAKHLKYLGEDGWELCAIDNRLFYFKRPKLE